MSGSAPTRPIERIDRSRARSWALQVLYRWEADTDETLDDALSRTLQTRLVSPRRTAYLGRLVGALEEHSRAVDEAISGALTNWTLGRLSVIDRSVLRIGVTEMLFFDDIPPKVAIREAMLLADRYGGPESPGFVNGVLDAIFKRQG